MAHTVVKESANNTKIRPVSMREKEKERACVRVCVGMCMGAMVHPVVQKCAKKRQKTQHPHCVHEKERGTKRKKERESVREREIVCV